MSDDIGAFIVTGEDSLHTAIARMEANGRGIVFVVDEAMRIVALLERDKVLDLVLGGLSDQSRVRDIISNDGHDCFDALDNIRLFLTDCDGCLTDGGMYYSEKGDELKRFDTKDGMAFALLRDAGYKVGVITGEDVELNRRRFAKLKADYYEPGCRDKLECVRRICIAEGIGLENVLYIGDDLIDLPLLKEVGFSCCPADAVEAVRDCVDYVVPAPGGHGVIRHVADLLLSRSPRTPNRR